MSYRKVPKVSGHLHHSSSVPTPVAPARPPIRKFPTDSPRSKPEPLPSLCQDTMQPSPEDTDSEGAEMPEVLLDRNRHIVPEWMLRSSSRFGSYHSFSSSSRSRVHSELSQAHRFRHLPHPQHHHPLRLPSVHHHDIFRSFAFGTVLKRLRTHGP